MPVSMRKEVKIRHARCCVSHKARIAQLVEQLICNQQVVGSIPTAGSILSHPALST